MESISIPKSSRKTKPDLTPKEVKPGDNIDIDTILFFAGQIRQKKALVQAAQKNLGMARKRAINAGLVMQELLEAMADADMDPVDVAAKYARRKQYAQALGTPIGTQFSLFDQPRTGILSHDELCEKAYQTGKVRGLMGENVDEQAYPPGTEFNKHHVEGWQAGQAVVLERIGQLESAEEAEAAAKKKKAEEKAGKKIDPAATEAAPPADETPVLQ